MFATRLCARNYDRMSGASDGTSVRDGDGERRRRPPPGCGWRGPRCQRGCGTPLSSNSAGGWWRRSRSRELLPGCGRTAEDSDRDACFRQGGRAELNPESPGIHRAEARIAAALPEGTPAPRLLGFFDEDGWVVLVFEDIEGAPPVLPWEAAELARVLIAVAELAVALTPAPIDAPTVADRFGEEFQGRRRLVEAQRRGDDDLARPRYLGVRSPGGPGRAGDRLGGRCRRSHVGRCRPSGRQHIADR